MRKKYDMYDICLIAANSLIVVTTIVTIFLLAYLKPTEANTVAIVLSAIIGIVIISFLFIIAKIGKELKKAKEEFITKETLKLLMEIKESSKKKEEQE